MPAGTLGARKANPSRNLEEQEIGKPGGDCLRTARWMFVRDDVQSRVRYISSDALEDGLEGIRTRWHSSKEYEDKEEEERKRSLATALRKKD